MRRWRVRLGMRSVEERDCMVTTGKCVITVGLFGGLFYTGNAGTRTSGICADNLTAHYPTKHPPQKYWRTFRRHFLDNMPENAPVKSYFGESAERFLISFSLASKNYCASKSFTDVALSPYPRSSPKHLKIAISSVKSTSCPVDQPDLSKKHAKERKNGVPLEMDYYTLEFYYILEWKMGFSEEAASAAVQCLIMDMIHPAVVPMHKVNFEESGRRCKGVNENYNPVERRCNGGKERNIRVSQKISKSLHASNVGNRGSIDGTKHLTVTPNSTLKNSTAYIQELSDKINEMKISLESMEKERDFYFEKLRYAEILCQKPEVEHLPMTKAILKICIPMMTNILLFLKLKNPLMNPWMLLIWKQRRFNDHVSSLHLHNYPKLVLLNRSFVPLMPDSSSVFSFFLLFL
ncbi:Microtubule-associated protein RP/EB family member 1B [Dendrobium catenatum]|uniref:Microtubule-associated protein RP/EB family member 1B n=1 Tax=Dendrobium catenatum TaxID=906689 RepID=A0A2I0W5X9_9ASPA|nr:Microtubule-associated protein RP/EB family member 1B [Dendrobium catenatum]